MKNSKSSLFLIELMISILFFSLTGAVCIQLFVKAHLVELNTRKRNIAIVWSQNLSALWDATEGDFSKIAGYLDQDAANLKQPYEIIQKNDELTVLLKESSNLEADILLSDQGFDESTGLHRAKLTFRSKEEPFYVLYLTHHPATQRGSLE